MGLLDGGIQSVFGSIFGSFYLPGLLTRVTLAPDGRGGGVAIPIDQNCRVQLDACTEVMRQQPGYTDTDMRILILQAGVDGGPVDTDCEVEPLAGPYQGRRFKIAWVTQDPAASYWECRGSLFNAADPD